MAGKSSFGGTVKLTGESEYKKAISQISNNLKVLSSEIKLSASEFKKSDNEMETAKNKSKSLNQQIDMQIQTILGLRDALYNAEKGYGENSKQATKWQIELNNAKAKLNDLTHELEDNEQNISKMENSLNNDTKELKEFEEAERKAGNSAITMGDLIKANIISETIMSGLKSLGNILINVTRQMGSAVINLGKSATESYAEYEQLIGGVETLFKDSAGVVKNYANNAYKTAGLSANEYMETVTSFSASLLQSLNNDTAKSAKVADMAITDMSDNANKMGTSMESIQNAYQGFAKQNYTMLDNLKLGYGGTKSEMERLLEDAEKITGIKYDISNLNDVYQAIHVIQGELGITGTTAKEASTTIQGSVNSMKTAWTNLITGLADDNADFGTLINNFVDSLIVASKNLLPRIKTTISGMGNLISSLLKELIPKIIKELPSLLEELFPLILGTFNTILETVIGMTPQLLNTVIKMIAELATTLGQQLPTLIPLIVNALISMVDTLINNIDLIIDAGIQLVMGLADGLMIALPQLIDRMPEIIDKLIIAVTDNLPKIIETGIILNLKLAEGLIKSIPKILATIPKIMSSLLNGLGNYLGNMLQMGGKLLNKVGEGLYNGISKIGDIGKNIVKGLWNGINDTKDWILNKVKGFGDSILKGLKSFFGIHSPSTVFRDEIGTYLAQGIGIGFENEMKSVNKEIQKSLPTDFDLGVNTTISKRIIEQSSFNQSSDNSLANIIDSTIDRKLLNNFINDVNITINNVGNLSEAELARQVRKEIQMLNLRNG